MLGTPAAALRNIPALSAQALAGIEERLAYRAPIGDSYLLGAAAIRPARHRSGKRHVIGYHSIGYRPAIRIPSAAAETRGPGRRRQAALRPRHHAGRDDSRP